MADKEVVLDLSEYGQVLRVLVKENGYELRHGITNKMICRYAQSIIDDDRVRLSEETVKQKVYTNRGYLTGDFVQRVCDILVRYEYAVTIQENVPKSAHIIEKLIDVTETEQMYQVSEEMVVAEEKSMDKYQAMQEAKLLVQAMQDSSEELKNENMETGKVIDEKQEVKEKQPLKVLDVSILLFRSSQWAFLVAFIGVVGQSLHIYHVTDNLSDLDGFAKIFNSALWAIFFSFGLMYFSLKYSVISAEDVVRKDKYRKTINWFIMFDIFANLYYWAYRFVLMPGVLDKYQKEFTDLDGNVYIDVDWQLVDWFTFEFAKVQWPQMIAATVFSFAIPFILKAFAGEVRLPEFLDQMFNNYDAGKEKEGV